MLQVVGGEACEGRNSAGDVSDVIVAMYPKFGNNNKKEVIGMSDFPYSPETVNWKRPPIDKQVLKPFTERSDVKGLLHSLGTLAILGTSGTFAYWMYLRQQWWWLALALYIHGGLYAFQPQTHEFSHGTVFKTKWLNALFKRIFGLVFWTGNSVLYRMSHEYHHRYTLHRKSEGEEVHPRPEPAETLLQTAVRVVDLTGLIMTLYDNVYALFVPFERNTRRRSWHRYVYLNSSPEKQRRLYWTFVSQFLFHLAFAIFSFVIGHPFLIVVVSLPGFYGGKWYAQFIHDTMHVGKQPETDDFRLCCRSVKLDPISSFLYWHMEYHVEHHTYAAIPCYNLKQFHQATREHWDAPQTLVEAWREMHQHSLKMLHISP